mmetsp:Transcript_26898/g.65306  ORF Transcript_26898/g.65306 Transcript_26898/m.65306 type:complete len:349 (+) Transcript_26898:534-1580(+)
MGDRPGARAGGRCAQVPPRRRPGRDPQRRRAAPRRPREAAGVRPRHPPPRRADEPPRRRVGRVARAVPQGLQRHGRRRDARPVLPGRLRRVDPGARPGERHPLRGQLQPVAGGQGGPPRAGGQAEAGEGEGAGEGARVGAEAAEGPAEEGKGADEAVRRAPRRVGGGAVPRGPRRDHDPSRPEARRGRAGGRRPREGFRRAAPLRRALVRCASWGDRRDHRGQRRGEDDAVQDGHRRRQPRPGEHPARGDGPAGVRRPGPGRARPGQVRLRAGRRRLRRARPRRPQSEHAGLPVLVQLPRGGPVEEGRGPLRWGAEPVDAGSCLAGRGEPPDARRADERPRRRDAPVP